ncbi:putative ntf2 and rrm domain-containing protein [Diplogelasinospora grovesii]|uniref:Ntf2 and rrm domain-containing protein n=1 Tax=Diplogelasinospora grovesii TaxID=303347 RepID=A0AAN6S431_9PEZI|nr:putative ntf2 and rrm domain-containing protein [Diplogelasinospora grovesii]
MATNGNHEYKSSGEQYAASATSTDAAGATSSRAPLPEDEVGWYFVEQYYTTLSKSPEKLHLFYGKKSQFVYGLEAEVAPISVGRRGIEERIKELDFQDCKVRISNVDSQASGENIVIQVIGETSNKAGEPKKFVQTFILAQQPSGYFVLNDILRYINEEGDEESEEAPAAAPAQEAAPSEVPAPAPEVEAEPEAPAPAEPVEEKEPAELDAAVVDQKLEEVKEAPAAAAAETPAEPAAEEQEPAAEEKAPSEPAPEPAKVAEEVAEEEAKKPEVPKDPTATPVATKPAAPPAAEPEKPKGPPKPMSWASRVAAAAGTRPVVPIPKTATPPAPAQSRAPAPAAPQAAPASAPAPAAAQAAEGAAPKDQGNEWQTAETKRQNRPQSISGAPTGNEGAMAYIKYVTDKVKDEDLRSTLAGFGELAYFDINRLKNCAFVEFKTQAGYTAAIAANPHVVNGESIVVEQRRPKANAYGGSNYNGTGRGVPGGGRGRGGFEGGRSASQGGGRGGFTGQPRGGRGGGAPRGRGGAAAQAGAA